MTATGCWCARPMTKFASTRGAVLTGRTVSPPSCGGGEPPVKSLYLDGEGVWCRSDGVAVFEELHNRENDDTVFLYAFDMLEIDGEDLRSTPLEQRKMRLRKLLTNRKSGHCLQRAFAR